MEHSLILVRAADRKGPYRTYITLEETLEMPGIVIFVYATLPRPDPRSGRCLKRSHCSNPWQYSTTSCSVPASKATISPSPLTCRVGFVLEVDTVVMDLAGVAVHF